MNTTDVIASAIEKLGINVLERPSDGSPYHYPWTAPQVLAGGSFAEALDGDEWQKVEKDYKKSLAASAINAAWVFDSVFIAKGKGKFHDTDLDGFDMRGLGKETRVCDDDSDYCYFFVCAQSFKNYYKQGTEWQKPKGLDKLEDYNITALEFAKAADWFQNKYGSYLVNPDANDILDAFRDEDNGPPSGLFVNMPVVDFDEAGAISAWDMHYTGSSMTPTAADYFANELAKYVSTLEHWPSGYSKMW